MFESFYEVMAYVYVTLIPAISTPYALFGHSMGARIAFEFAREMRRRQLLSPVRLCVTGANAPQTTNFKPPYIHQLPDDELFAFLREFGGPEEFFHDIELQKFFIPLLRSDFKAAESYRYHHEPPLSCPISVWGGTDDIFTTLSGLEAWQEQTTADFQLRIINGPHQFINIAHEELLKTMEKDLTQH